MLAVSRVPRTLTRKQYRMSLVKTPFVHLLIITVSLETPNNVNINMNDIILKEAPNNNPHVFNFDTKTISTAVS